MKKILLNITFIFILIYSSNSYSYNKEFPPTNDNGIYFLLIKGDNFITRAAKLFGYPGTCWHIEVLSKGYSYGCRPFQCSRISYNELQQKFRGENADIRTMPIKGDVTKAIEFFYKNIHGKTYDLFSTNCTWAIWELSKAYGVEKPLVQWINVKEALKLPKVQEFLQRERAGGINLQIQDKIEYILFPDEFMKIGIEYSRDILL